MDLAEFSLLVEDDRLFYDLLEIEMLQGASDSREFTSYILQNGVEGVEDEAFRVLFRFTKEDVTRLVTALQLPAVIVLPNRRQVGSYLALLMLLRRLAYPNRLSDLEGVFGVSAGTISRVVNTTAKLILSKWDIKLENLRNLQYLNEEKMEEFSESIFNKGAPLQNCWAFIDGTARPISRPGTSQRDFYSGHKRQHCLKYQGLLTPDGMLVSLHGAYPGRRHDAGLFAGTGLYQQLEENCVFPDRSFYIFGDSAYRLRALLIAPYVRTPNITDDRTLFNTAMSKTRIAVEWGFGKITTIFSFVDFKKNQKLLLQDVVGMFRVATLLTNCHTCLYGSQTSDYFGVPPPSLEQYLATNEI